MAKKSSGKSPTKTKKRMAESVESAMETSINPKGRPEMKGRGYSGYYTNTLVRISGVTKDGERHTVNVEPTWTQTDPFTAILIYQRCAPVFGVITGRANYVSTTPFSVEPIRKNEDREADRLKDLRDIFNENADSLQALGIRIKCFEQMRRHLLDLKPDLSNFDASLYRWMKRIRNIRTDQCNEISDWFQSPSLGETWSSFVKKYVTDLLSQGRVAVKLDQDPIESHRIGQMYILPGGTVSPIASKYVGGPVGYVQMLYGSVLYGSYEPQIFFRDEVSFAHYMPNSATEYGMLPLDALINMVTENMLFDRSMAETADGTENPHMAVAFGDRNPGLDIDEIAGQGEVGDIPLDLDEQRRIEWKLNTPQRRGAIAVLTGHGTPVAIDLSKASIMKDQMDRQDQISKFVGLVYNATQMEMNESGSGDTSGRSTSESQERIESRRGSGPIIQILEEKMNTDWIPRRFGYGYQSKFQIPMTELEKVALQTAKKNSGVYTINEIRTEDENREPFPEEQYNRPQGQTPAEQANDTMKQIQDGLKNR